jgi:Helix-turn-helix domain
MMRRQAYRYELLRPTSEQCRRMSQIAGCCRYVYNRAWVDSSGHQVKRKASLNRSILDQAWGEWRRHVLPCNRKTQALFLCLDSATRGMPMMYRRRIFFLAKESIARPRAGHGRGFGQMGDHRPDGL